MFLAKIFASTLCGGRSEKFETLLRNMRIILWSTTFSKYIFRERLGTAINTPIVSPKSESSTAGYLEQSKLTNQEAKAKNKTEQILLEYTYKEMDGITAKYICATGLSYIYFGVIP